MSEGAGDRAQFLCALQICVLSFDPFLLLFSLRAREFLISNGQYFYAKLAV